jgi:hypothetical protein
VLKAITYSTSHPVEASEAVAKYFQVDPEKYRTILGGVAFAGTERNREYFGSRRSHGQLYDVATRAAAVWRKAGVISTPVHGEDIIATEFVQGKDR